MNNSITKKLEKGEQILWTGNPVKKKFLDEDVKTKYIIELIITVAVCVFLVIGYMALARKNNTEVMPLMIGVIVLLAVLPVSSIFTIWRALSSTVYAITNQRAIIFRGGDNILSIDLSLVDTCTVVTGKNGMDSLCIGSPTCKIATHKLRTAGVDCVRVTLDDNTCITYPVFYSIKDAQKAKAILESAL